MAFPLLINFLFITLVGARKPPIETFSLPIPAMNGSTNLAQFAGYQALDTNYVTTPNATSYEWWYFDTVASDLSASVVFQPSITYGYPESSLDLRFSIAFPDGTEKEFIIPKQSLHLSTIGEASVGVAGDGSFSWVGSPSLSTYTINLDLADIGVKGEIQLQSVSYRVLYVCGALTNRT